MNPQEKCLHYFTSFDQFVGLLYNKKIYIFNLDYSSDIIPESLLNLGDKNIEIKKLIQEYDTIQNSRSKNLKFSEIKNILEHNIENFKFLNIFLCHKYINLNKAHSLIKDLNNKLNKFCDNSKKNTLSLNYVFDLENKNAIKKKFDVSQIEGTSIIDENSLLLCYFNENNCVSQILLSLEDDLNDKKFLSIDSNTSSLYEGKKLNQLLRAVIIIIAKAINPEILYIRSNAVSPTSLYLLIKYFNGIILNDDDTIETTLTSSNITHEKSRQYIKKNGGKMIYIDLNSKNIETASSVFDNLVDTSSKKKLDCLTQDVEKDEHDYIYGDLQDI